MPNPILPPLDPGPFTFPPAPAEFVELVASTLGNLGTKGDGFDSAVLAIAANDPATVGMHRDMSMLFEQHGPAWASFNEPFEAPAGEALKASLDSGDAALGVFESLFVTAPAKPGSPGVGTGLPPALPNPPAPITKGPPGKPPVRNPGQPHRPIARPPIIET